MGIELPGLLDSCHTGVGSADHVSVTFEPFLQAASEGRIVFHQQDMIVLTHAIGTL